jgi:hypothetical protein
MSKYHIGWSANQKTGAMYVSTSSSDTCPEECQHLKLNTCYAKFSFLGMHWRRVDQVGVNWDELCQYVHHNVPDGQLWRHNQAGDLPGLSTDNSQIDLYKLQYLVSANRGKRGFTYTHKYKSQANRFAIKFANDHGFTVNISADSYLEASLYFKEGFPTTVTVGPDDLATVEFKGVRFITCPAVTHDTNCVKCGLCAIKHRNFVIKFPSHGSRKNYWQIKKVS